MEEESKQIFTCCRISCKNTFNIMEMQNIPAYGIFYPK